MTIQQAHDEEYANRILQEMNPRLFKLNGKGPGEWYRVEDSKGNVIGEIMTATTGMRITGWVFKIGNKLYDTKKHQTGGKALNALLLKHQDTA